MGQRACGRGRPCAQGGRHVPLCPLSSGRLLGRTLGHLGAGHLRFLGHVVANLSSCVLLDRFQALESAAVLEANAQALMRQNNFLAGECPATGGPRGHRADGCQLPTSP